MIAKTGRYYILEGAQNVHSENEYINIMKDAYEESIAGIDDFEVVTFDEYINADDELLYVIDIDTKKIREYETLADLNSFMRTQLCNEELDCNMADDKYRLAIEKENYSYILTENIKINVEYDILNKEIDMDNAGNTAIRIRGLYFI